VNRERIPHLRQIVFLCNLSWRLTWIPVNDKAPPVPKTNLMRIWAQKTKSHILDEIIKTDIIQMSTQLEHFIQHLPKSYGIHHTKLLHDL